jgi:hypothetical protein
MQDQLAETVNAVTSNNNETANMSENISTSTVTMTHTNTSAPTNEGEILPLTLRARPTVTW